MEAPDGGSLSPRRRAARLLRALGGLLVLLVLMLFVATAVGQVFWLDPAATYVSSHGLRIHHVAVVVLPAAVALVLVAGVLAHAWEGWQWRRFALRHAPTSRRERRGHAQASGDVR